MILFGFIFTFFGLVMLYVISHDSGASLAYWDRVIHTSLVATTALGIILILGGAVVSIYRAVRFRRDSRK